MSEPINSSINSITLPHLLRLLWLCLAFNSLTIATANAFDHDATRFPLDGFHRFVECEVCHVNGRFKGTPMDCRACHGTSSLIPGGGKSPHHVMSSDNCSDCHSANTWDQVVRFDHSQAPGTCVSCHNGVQQPGKPLNHVVSSNDCESCHTTVTWSVARFDHSGITEPCSSCHNNVTATGKPGNHVVTTQECDQCHSTRAWSPAGFDHSGITQACSSCHNNVTATGKHTGHINTSAECDVCHTTRAWSPASFDHSNVTGSCSSCHNGVTATGKDNNHFVTNRECDYCHSNTTWNISRFSHQSSAYPGEHRRALDCNDCHIGNIETNVWRFPAYQPDCAACHSNDFESGAHRKVESPRINYTVSELRDCTGACHVYRDSSLTTINDFRNARHRITDPDFDD